MPKLVVTVEDKLLSESLLADGEILIGRGPDCHIVVRDPLVSRHHAKIARAYGGYFVEDLNSTNGVMVNGRRVNKQMLKYGDRVQIGTHDLCLTPEDDEDNKDEDNNETKVMMKPTSPFQPSTPQSQQPSPTQQIISPEREKERSVNRPHVRYLTGPVTGASEPVEKMYTIGEPGSSLAAISKRGQSYVLQRVGIGGKGTITVNGEPMVGPSVRLNSGDIVQVGSTQLEFYLET